jgi:hypothetical protein
MTNFSAAQRREGVEEVAAWWRSFPGLGQANRSPGRDAMAALPRKWVSDGAPTLP